MNFLHKIFSEFNEISVMIRLLLAVIMGGLIGLERGRHGRAAGLRTHILVCVGAAMTSVTSLFLTYELGSTGDIGRISAQVISGIGFLGAGMILIRNNSVVTGLTTAAGMWTTATIGIAVGYGFYVAAVFATVLCIFCVTVLSFVERNKKRSVYVYVELNEISATGRIVDLIRNTKNSPISVEVGPAKSGCTGNVGILCLVSGHDACDALCDKIENIDEISYIIKDINP